MCYAIDLTKNYAELGWLLVTKFADRIKKTMEWYLENCSWWEEITSREYQNYHEKMYGAGKSHHRSYKISRSGTRRR